ncbi:MAG: M48 family metallopeptidase [Ignavibacteriaceae bacterium]|nr:M48 family metallopeptidase [Ignavibacterium sp.]MCC6255705.1 M48 family metallopeptidase [Ignavibacteriaceae bacterium]HRN25312.1 M48 family metallopeptidase [Ignavibacteriaceae bacterium]HRP91621.1 M48 family metallopeptidase [Ignavibacteriaceae bacterium]HRQ53056.1 M48 family metallopeptidase [Ignavibacteriaceae bacterium]
MNSKKYNNTKLAIGIGKTIVSFILLYLFIALGYSVLLQNYIQNFTENSYLAFLIFVFTIGIFSSILFMPINIYTGFYLEHKYKLSNQNFYKYFIENVKSMLVGLAIGIPILLLFFFVLNQFGDLWWVVFASAMFLISVVLSQIFPILILPIFYKILPLDDDELKTRISNLAKGAGIKVENVFTFDMSKNTKKANAAFTGLGKTKRIILGDTLLNNYSKDEIETVIAHELGHYKHKHIIKNILFGTVSSFLTFFIISILYKNSLSWFDFKSITQIAALPLLSLWAMIIGLIQSPIGNILSRKYEYEADRYAIESTLKPESFISTLNKLTDQNLGDREPHPFVEWFFYSHPSIKNRINAIKIFANEKSITEIELSPERAS